MTDRRLTVARGIASRTRETFASSEGQRGGEYVSPTSIVKTLVAVLNHSPQLSFTPAAQAGPC